MSGLFGIVARSNCNDALFYGTDYHSHMGTEKAGMAIMGTMIHRSIHDISQAQFKSKFADEYKNMPGQLGIGVISDGDPQPIIISTHFGEFALATTGRLENARPLIRELHTQGIAFSELTNGEINRTEIVARIIAQGKDPVEGICKVFERIQGSCTLLLLTREGIYAARDRYGRSPLVIGRRGGEWAVASESCSFTNLGFRVERDLEPAEIVFIDKEMIRSMRQGASERKICTFLWIYTGYPASSYEGIPVEAVRERCGGFLARNDDVEADFVAGVPDSGTGHAIGYAMEAGIPFRRPLVKYTPGYGRSYTPPSQEIRDLVAEMKLIPIQEIIAGKRIVLCEDSIVRGTQLRNLTIQKLWDNGAKEIHLRPACPPLMHPCRYLVSTRHIHELAARRAIGSLEGKDLDDISEYLDESSSKYTEMVEWIRKDLNVTTLRYQRMENMVQAIGLPRGELCLWCWTGR